MKIDENMLCPVCNAKLFTDEVAFCPDCGAPHHKQCYLNLGHCAYEEFHGTENQWQPPKIEPPKEQEPNPKEQEENKTEIPPQFQGRFNQDAQPSENPFFKANGIDKNEDIGGESAENIAKFVGYNALRYIRIFRKFATKKTKISWNWVAFFFPELWLVSRKCYPQAILTAFYSILHSVIYTLGMESPEIVTFMQTLEVTPGVMNVANILFVTSLINIVISFIFGMFGDYIYKKKVYTDIAQMKAEGRISEIDFIQKGGVNLMLPAVLYVAISVLSYILTTFIG